MTSATDASHRAATQEPADPELGHGSTLHDRSRSITAAADILLGVLAAAILAAAAATVSALVPGALGAVPIAVGLGLVVGQFLPRQRIDCGVHFVATHVLKLGVILLGARLSIGEVATLGFASVGLVLVIPVLGFATAMIVGRRLQLSDEVRGLLAVGSAICGNTAVMAAAPVLRARSREVGLVVATITLCGTVSLVVYPIVGRLLGLSDVSFGLWAGLSIQDTSQVIAASSAYSDSARDVATVVKLVRSAALAAVLPMLAWWRGRRSGGEDASSSALNAFPLFVLGFLALAALRSVGAIGDTVAGWISEVASWAILLAVAGLGLSVKLGDLQRASIRTIATGLAAAAALGASALAAAIVVGPILG